MKKIIIIFAIAIASLILVRFLYSFISGIYKGKYYSNVQIPNVKVETVKNKRVRQCYEVPGRVESVYQVSIVARVSGYLLKTYFKEGSFIKKGDTLFLIEPDEYQEGANAAYADVKKIQAQLNYANKQLQRAQELVKQDYIAKAKYDEILSNRDSLSAQLLAAQNKLKDKSRNLSYTTIKSPIDGRVGTIDISIGNYVTPSSESLTTINSINPMYVIFSLPSTDYNEITNIDKNNNQNRKVELYFNNGDKYNINGVQDFTDNKVDQNTATVSLRAKFNNPDSRLIHGEFVNVKIYANNASLKPVIPLTAVQSNQEGKYVYRLNEKNLPQITYIKDSGQIGDYLIIKYGLSAGDKVIIEGVSKVNPGHKVNIIE